MCGDIGAIEARETLQFDHRMATIDADICIAAMGRDVVVRFQVVQRMALDVQLIARDEVRDDVLTARFGMLELERIVAGAAGHGVVP